MDTILVRQSEKVVSLAPNHYKLTTAKTAQMFPAVIMNAFRNVDSTTAIFTVVKSKPEG
jgi:hypothetical protein